MILSWIVFYFNGKDIFKISFCKLNNNKKKEANRALVTYCEVNWNNIITILPIYKKNNKLVIKGDMIFSWKTIGHYQNNKG